LSQASAYMTIYRARNLWYRKGSLRNVHANKVPRRFHATPPTLSPTFMHVIDQTERIHLCLHVLICTACQYSPSFKLSYRCTFSFKPFIGLRQLQAICMSLSLWFDSFVNHRLSKTHRSLNRSYVIPIMFC